MIVFLQHFLILLQSHSGLGGLLNWIDRSPPHSFMQICIVEIENYSNILRTKSGMQCILNNSRFNFWISNQFTEPKATN